MFKEKFLALQQEIVSFSWKEKSFLLCAMLCGFFISADYAIIRPVSNSLFIHAYGAKMFPYAWLIGIPFNLLIVSLYNYFLPKLGCFRMFLFSTALITAGNLFCAVEIQKIPFLPFGFYIWKEVYVMLMFQQLWSVIHATVQLKKAKYLYGFLFGIGALGGFSGSFLPGFFAVKMGSESLLFSTLPIYAALTLSYFWLLKFTDQIDRAVGKETAASNSLPQGIRLIFSSRLLLSILAMVCFMQITATLTDFQFHSMLERIYPDKDVRTEFIGKIACIGNVLTMSFQFFGTFLLVHFLGLQRSHFLVPFLLSLNAVIFVFFPVFGLISYSFIVIKSFDFSLFGVIKEMLYIPMRIEEKFQAKAIIDVFMYRTSKAIASFSILCLQLLTSQIQMYLSWVNLAIFVGWCLLVASMKEDYAVSERRSLEKAPSA
jgi:ATP:ADP antiporter, AAA family